jgi:DNA-binding MarR family transcriptional regulator
MTTNFESENLVLRLWFLMHRDGDALMTCEDQVFGEYDLTSEQYSVLMTIKYLREPVRVTDIAHWLERSTNSISMIVDRMVKAGLLRRVRDRKDRRVVNVFITSKGEKALKPASVAGLEFIREVLSPISYEDRRTLVSLLETVKYKAFKYLNPRIDVEEMIRNEAESHANLFERLTQYISPSIPEAKRQGAKKEKTIG